MNLSDYNNTLATFYADDGLLENKDPVALQKDLNAIIKHITVRMLYAYICIFPRLTPVTMLP